MVGEARDHMIPPDMGAGEQPKQSGVRSGEIAMTAAMATESAWLLHVHLSLSLRLLSRQCLRDLQPARRNPRVLS